jgi:hypothetical protein
MRIIQSIKKVYGATSGSLWEGGGEGDGVSGSTPRMTAGMFILAGLGNKGAPELGGSGFSVPNGVLNGFETR